MTVKLMDDRAHLSTVLGSLANSYYSRMHRYRNGLLYVQEELQRLKVQDTPLYINDHKMSCLSEGVNAEYDSSSGYVAALVLDL